MNLESIRAAFQNAFEASEIIRVKLPPDAPCYYEYKIYPLKCLAQLRDEVRHFADGDMAYSSNNSDFVANYAVRFVVDVDGVIHFTREGPRTTSVPAHSDITHRVLTAGNLYFSEDYSRIVKITNKSGHFQPAFGTLVFALPLILASDFPLADEICLVDETNQEHEQQRFTLDELVSLKPTAYDLEAVKAMNRSTTVFIDAKELELTIQIPNESLSSASIFPAKSKPLSRPFEAIDSGYETPDPDATFFKSKK